MIEFKPGQTYRFKNKLSGLYMNIAGYSDSEYAKCEQWELQGGGMRDFQLWHVFQLDNGTCIVINKGSRLCLGVSGNSNTEGAKLEQRPLLTAEEFDSEPKANARTEANRLWNFQPDDQHPGYFRISNDGSGLYINTESNSRQPSTKCEQWRFENSESQLWALELEATLPKVANLYVKPGDIGDITRLSGFSPPKERGTPPVMMGRVAVPFFMVQDGSPREQVRLNPYYILTRSSFWEMVGFDEVSGQAVEEKTASYKAGVTTSNAKVVEEKTSTSTTASAGLEYEGASASVSMTLTRELNITTSASEEKQQEWEWVVKRSFKDDQTRRAFTDWMRVEQYELKRMDGTLVIQWQARSRSETKQDSYAEVRKDSQPAPILKSNAPPRPAAAAVLAMVSPDGWRVEGLSVESAAELLRRLRN